MITLVSWICFYKITRHRTKTNKWQQHNKTQKINKMINTDPTIHTYYYGPHHTYLLFLIKIWSNLNCMAISSFKISALFSIAHVRCILKKIFDISYFYSQWALNCSCLTMSSLNFFLFLIWYDQMYVW